jgi:hypothetical protein
LSYAPGRPTGMRPRLTLSGHRPFSDGTVAAVGFQLTATTETGLILQNDPHGASPMPPQRPTAPMDQFFAAVSNSDKSSSLTGDRIGGAMTAKGSSSLPLFGEDTGAMSQTNSSVRRLNDAIQGLGDLASENLTFPMSVS